MVDHDLTVLHPGGPQLIGRVRLDHQGLRFGLVHFDGEPLVECVAHGAEIVAVPVELAPLASTFFYIKEYDTTGGPGANFIVEWRSEQTINMPIIESIILGLGSGQGISLACPGQVITKHDR